MKNYYKFFIKTKRDRILLISAGLLALSAVIFFLFYFSFEGKNRFLIKKEHYGFELKTPKNWFAQENTVYSEENVSKILAECKKYQGKESIAYEIGAFRFEDQKYPQDIGFSGSPLGSFPKGLPTGAILEVTVNCVPDIVKEKIVVSNDSKMKISGEKTFEENLNLTGFGETKYISLFHNGLQYRITEYIYISPDDKEKSDVSAEKGLRKEYAEIFNKIILSFKFIQ